MNKLLMITLSLLMMIPTANAANYITDNLYIYLRSGPSDGYRAIGSVNAGEKIDLLSEDKTTNYSQIRDDGGRVGWIESKYVSNTESMSVRMPLLEKELSEVKEKLAASKANADTANASLLSSLESKNKQISELESSYSKVNQQLSNSQSEIRELKAKLDTQKDDLLFKYFTYGGSVAGLGLLLGLILPHLIPRKRRSPSGWA